MYTKNQISPSRKILYAITLLAVFLSAFGGGNFHSVRAQAATGNETGRNGNTYESQAVPAQTAGTHQITYFKDNKAGAVSFTFDDGYTSQTTTAISELNARGLKGTFFVITGSAWIDGHVPWSTWQSVVAQGHEVASHTVNHVDLTTLSEGEVRSELTGSQAAIIQNIPGQACASLSYPTTASNPTVQAAAADYYVAARGGFLNDGGDGYLNYSEAGSDQSGSWNAINFYNVGSRSGDGMIPSTDTYFNYLLDTAVSRHAWFDLHFHQITDANAFGGILDYVRGKHDYWIDTFCNVSRYMKEQLNSTVQVVTDNSSEIRLNVLMDASLSTSIYNFPLTLRSTVPASWTQVMVQQGSAIQTLTPVLESSEKVIYYDAIPNGGDVLLSVSVPTATNTLPSTPIGTPTTTQTPSRTPTATATILVPPWYAPSGSTLVTAVTNPNNAFTSNNAYATFNANGNTANYTTFSIPAIPAGATINGIEVSVEGYNGQAAGRNLQIQMSWNGGTNFTTVTTSRTTSLPIADGIVILGSAVDTWGRAWSTTEFTNANFTIKATSTGGALPPVYLDQLQVRIYFTVSGNTPTSTFTSIPTVIPTNTLTSTPTILATNTSTSIPTFTATNVPTVTATNMPTYTPSYTPTPTYTTTNTLTTLPSSTPTLTATNAPTATPTNTLTDTPTYTSTSTSTAILTNTPTSVLTFTETNAPTITPEETLTFTPTYTSTSAPTFTQTNTPTVIFTNTLTSIPMFTKTNTPTVTLTNTFIYTPTYTATNTLTRTPTATRTSTPPNLPTNTALPTATNTPANTGFVNPNSNAAQTGGDGNGYQTNPINAYTNNSVFAVDTNSGTNSDSTCTSSGKDKHQFYNYGFSIPGTTVPGIEVKLDARADGTSGSPKLCIQLSWDGGTSWTAAKQTGTLRITEQTYTLGSPLDNWGHTWTLSQLSNASFRVRIINVATSTSRDFSLDWITVRVTYQ